MHNQHVYVYFRFKAWVATQCGNWQKAEFLRDFARQEAVRQCQ